MCGVEYKTNTHDNVTLVDHVVAIAGDYHLVHGQPLESEVYRLKGSESHADSDKEGVRVVLSGGKDPMGDKKGVKQRAIIEFLCDPSTDGKNTEVDDRPEDPADGGKDEKEGKARRDEEEKKSTSPLRFIGYEKEQVRGEDWGTLRLEWRTKFACEGQADVPSGSSSGGWGFFTWLIIMYVLPSHLLSYLSPHNLFILANECV